MVHYNNYWMNNCYRGYFMKGKAYTMVKYRTMESTTNKNKKNSYSQDMRRFRGSVLVETEKDYIIIARGISGKKRSQSRRRIMQKMLLEEKRGVIQKRENEN